MCSKIIISHDSVFRWLVICPTRRVELGPCFFKHFPVKEGEKNAELEKKGRKHVFFTPVPFLFPKKRSQLILFSKISRNCQRLKFQISARKTSLDR